MSLVNLDVITPFLALAALHCRVARAEVELETHKGRFESTEALLKLVKHTRDSRVASLNRETYQEWEEWIDGVIISTEQVLADMKEVVQRKGERGNRTFIEKLSWVTKQKGVAENLEPRLDLCFASLLVILSSLVSERDRQSPTGPPEPEHSASLSRVWLEDDDTPYNCFSGSGLACPDGHSCLRSSNSPCFSRTPTGLSSVFGAAEPLNMGRCIEEEEGQEIEMWLLARARRILMEAEEDIVDD